MLQICGLEYYDELVRMFYAYLRMSKDRNELETLVLGNQIIVNDFLFEHVFGTKFSGIVPYMNET